MISAAHYLRKMSIPTAYLPRGGRGVLVEITPKGLGSLSAYATGKPSKLALVNIHLPSNAAN